MQAAKQLSAQYPDLQIVGVEAPRLADLSTTEHAALLERIRFGGPRFTIRVIRSTEGGIVARTTSSRAWTGRLRAGRRRSDVHGRPRAAGRHVGCRQSAWSGSIESIKNPCGLADATRPMRVLPCSCSAAAHGTHCCADRHRSRNLRVQFPQAFLRKPWPRQSNNLSWHWMARWKLRRSPLSARASAPRWRPRARRGVARHGPAQPSPDRRGCHRP